MSNQSSRFEWYARLVLRYRSLVMVLVIAITAVLMSSISSLKIDTDPDIWTPQSHPYVKATKDIERIFGGRNFTLIGISPRQGDVYQPQVLAKIQRIQRAFEAAPNAIGHNINSLAARQAQEITGTEGGLRAHPLMETIPTSPEAISRLKAAVAANPVYINALVSADGKTASVVADFKTAKGNPSYAVLYDAIRKIVDKERDASVDIYMGGASVQNAWLERHMMKMPVWFGCALLAIMVLQYLCFRSFQGMLLPVVTALVSVIWGLGLMGLLRVHMDAMNTTTPILIMAIASGHAIQILRRYYEEYLALRANRPPGRSDADLSKEAIVVSLSRVGPAMVTAGLIAALTLFTLTSASVSVVRNFGVFAGCGVLSALVLELTLIPALRSWLKPPTDRWMAKRAGAGWLDAALRRLAEGLAKGRAPWALLLMVGVIAGSLLGLTRLHADNSLKRFNAENSEVRRDDAALNDRLGGTQSMLLLVEGKTPDAIKNPRVLKGMEKLQAFFAHQPQVGKTQSMADFIKRMNMAMHGDRPEYNVIPDDAQLVAQYLLLYSLSGKPQDFDSFVDNDYQRGMVLIFLKDDSTAYAEKLFKAAQPIIQAEFPPDVTVRFGGNLAETIAINDTLTREKFINMGQMVLVVLVLSAIALRSIVGGLFVMMPLCVIILANLGLMGWLNIPLDMGTATAAAMAIGIGADYELYLLFRFREELAKGASFFLATRDSLLTAGKAILYVALSIACGYSVLLASDFAFYSRLATMVIATMVVSSVSALVFLRSLMVVFQPAFVLPSSGRAPVEAPFDLAPDSSVSQAGIK